MNDDKRLKMKNINRILMELKNNKEVNLEIDELKKMALTIQYSELLNHKKRLIPNSEMINNKIWGLILSTFLYAFHGNNQNLKCFHPSWIYLGSYDKYFKLMGYNEEHSLYDIQEDVLENEQSPKFKINKYGCLNCGKIIEVCDWQAFENKHDIYSLPDDLEQKLEICHNILSYNDPDNAQKQLRNSLTKRNVNKNGLNL